MFASMIVTIHNFVGRASVAIYKLFYWRSNVGCCVAIYNFVSQEYGERCLLDLDRGLAPNNPPAPELPALHNA